MMCGRVGLDENAIRLTVQWCSPLPLREELDSIDNDAAGDLADRVFGCSGRLQRGRRM